MATIILLLVNIGWQLTFSNWFIRFVSLEGPILSCLLSIPLLIIEEGFEPVSVFQLWLLLLAKDFISLHLLSTRQRGSKSPITWIQKANLWMHNSIYDWVGRMPIFRDKWSLYRHKQLMFVNWKCCCWSQDINVDCHHRPAKQRTKGEGSPDA